MWFVAQCFDDVPELREGVTDWPKPEAEQFHDDRISKLVVTNNSHTVADDVNTVYRFYSNKNLTGFSIAPHITNIYDVIT